MSIFENKVFKAFSSENYHYTFNKETGYFERFGKTPDDDPDFSEFGPEIADIEVTTKCMGVGGKLCPFCYKSNTPNGENMSFETFKKMLDKFPKYRSNCIILTLENNKKIILQPEQKVQLEDGRIEKVSNLKNENDIVKII